MKIIPVVIIFFYNSTLIFASRPCPVINLSNGSVKYRSKGRIARFRCNRGFSLVGENYIACIKGQWDTDTPKCVPRSRCSPITEIQNGHVLANKQWTSLLFYCNSGYHLSGPSKLFCKNSNWSGEVPKCQTNIQLSCDFEKPGNCGWDNSTKSGYFWIRRQYATPSHYLDTGPGHDHTLHPKNNGHYLYIETSGLYGKNLKTTIARLFSPLFPPVENNGTCFTFWYHMFGTTVGELIVYIDGHKVFHRSGNQGNRWIRGIITNLPTDTFFQISIEGIPGNGWTGDIAIDDLNITTSSECLRPYLEETTCDGRCYEEEAQNSTLCKCTQDCLASSTCCGDFFEACNADTTTASAHFSEYKEETTELYSEELTSSTFDFTNPGLIVTKYNSSDIQVVSKLPTEKTTNSNTYVTNSDFIYKKDFSISTTISNDKFSTTDRNELYSSFTENTIKIDHTNFDNFEISTESEANIFTVRTTTETYNGYNLFTSTERSTSLKENDTSTLLYTSEHSTSDDDSLSSVHIWYTSDLELDNPSAENGNNSELLVKNNTSPSTTTLSTNHSSTEQVHLFTTPHSIPTRDSSEISQSSDLFSDLTLETSDPHTHLPKNESTHQTTKQYEVSLNSDSRNLTVQTSTSYFRLLSGDIIQSIMTTELSNSTKLTDQSNPNMSSTLSFHETQPEITNVMYTTISPKVTDHTVITHLINTLSAHKNLSSKSNNTTPYKPKETDQTTESYLTSLLTVDTNHSLESKKTIPLLHNVEFNKQTTYLINTPSDEKSRTQPSHHTEITKQNSTFHFTSTLSPDKSDERKETTHSTYSETEQLTIHNALPTSVHIQLAQTERSKWKSAYQPKGYYTYSAMKQEQSGSGLKNISIIIIVTFIVVTIASIISILYIIYRRRNYLNTGNDVEEADVLFIANDEMLDFSVSRPKKNARHDNINKSLL